MTDPWRDPEYYKEGKLVQCLGCGETCHETFWGKWCYGCNVARIKRISKTLDQLIWELGGASDAQDGSE